MITHATYRRGAALSQALAALVALAIPATALANDGEAKMFTVTNWTTCSGGARPLWDDMTWRWYTTLADGPSYSQDGSWTDGNLTVDVLCDWVGDPDCQDNVNIDDADAAMIGLHGGDSGNHWRGTMRAMSPTSGECFIDSPEGAASDQFFLGFDLDILHLSSCQSMDDDNLPYAWRMMSNPGFIPIGRVRVVTGFHGLMWIGSGFVDDYEDMADDGQDVSIKAAWLDTMYDYWIGEDDVDQCPVAYAIGTSLADCQSRLNSVRYGNEGVKSPNSASYCFAAIAGCDPAGETKFTKP